MTGEVQVGPTIFINYTLKDNVAVQLPKLLTELKAFEAEAIAVSSRISASFSKVFNSTVKLPSTDFAKDTGDSVAKATGITEKQMLKAASAFQKASVSTGGFTDAVKLMDSTAAASSANGLNKASTAAVKMEKDFKAATTQVNLFRDGLTALPAVIVAVGAAYAVKQASGFQDDITTLTVLNNTLAETQQQFEFMKNFAISTPFNTKELVDADIQLKNIGIDGPKAIVSIADAAASRGRTIEQATNAYASAISGYPRALRDYGIYAYQINKQNMDKLQTLTQETLKEGETAYIYLDKSGKTHLEQASKFNKQATAETIEMIFSEKFKGAVEARSKTMSGLYSTLVDDLQIASAEMAGMNLDDVTAETSGFVKVVTLLEQGAVKLATAFLELSPSTKTAIGNFSLMLGSISLLTTAFIVIPVVMKAATAATTAYGISLSAAIWPATAIVVGLAVLGVTLSELDKRTGIVTKSWQLLKDVAVIAWDGIKKEVSDVKIAVSGTIDTLKTKADELGGHFKTIADSTAGYYKGITDYIKGLSTTFESAVDKASKAAEAIRMKDKFDEQKRQHIQRYNDYASGKAPYYTENTTSSLPEDFEDTTAKIDDSVKYTQDAYGQLIKTATVYTSEILPEEVAEYQKVAQAAGQSAEFQLLENGKVQVAIKETTKLIQTERGKYEEAVQKAQESGIKNTYNFSTNSMGEQTRNATQSLTTFENGVKKTFDTVNTEIIDAYGRVIGHVKEVTQTTDDGITQVISKSASEFQNKFNRVVETARDSSGRVTRTTHDTQTKMINGLKTTIDSATTQIRDSYGRIIDTIREVTKTVDDGITQTVSKSASQISNMMNKETETVRDAAGNITSTVTATQTSVVNGVKTIIETITGTVRDSYGKVIGYTKDMIKTVDDGINKVVSKTQEAMSNQNTRDIQNTVDAAGNIVQVITDTQTKVQNGLSTVTKTITTNSYDANQSLVSSVQDITQTLDDGVNKITNSYNNLGNAAIGQTLKTFKSATGDIVQMGYAGGSSTNVAGLSKIVNNLPTTTANLPKPVISVATGVNNAADSLSSSLSSLNGISFNPLVSNMNGVQKALTSLVSLSRQFSNNMQTALKYENAVAKGATVINRNKTTNNNYYCGSDRTQKTRSKMLGGMSG